MQNTFTVSPTNQQITLYPGQAYEGTIMVTNAAGATSDFHYKAEVVPYSVIGEEYTIDLRTQSERTSISKWITIDEPVGAIEPNAVKDLKFTINVPENAPVGGQYAVIAISHDEDYVEQEGMNIQNVYEIASVIYGNVNGEVVHDGEIIENEVPVFSFDTAVDVGALIVNNGNTHEVARVTVKVSDYFDSGHVIVPSGMDTGSRIEVIMPETTRYTNYEVKGLSSLGMYKVTQTIDYNGRTSEVEKTLIVCPIWLVVLAVVVVMTIITTIILMIRRHRRNKNGGYSGELL